jgi:hypothetical protein
MPLFRVTFSEVGGYRVFCRVRAPWGTQDSIVIAQALASVPAWGDEAVWVPTPGATDQGRVYREAYTLPVSVEDAPPLHPLTGLMTVTVEPVAQRRQELTG